MKNIIFPMYYEHKNTQLKTFLLFWKLANFGVLHDPEAYLDWEFVVQQKFDSHNVPAEHRVRLATSEFTNFSLFWWSDLCNTNNAAAVPQT